MQNRRVVARAFPGGGFVIGYAALLMCLHQDGDIFPVKHLIQFLKILAVAIPFSLVASSIEPYPNHSELLVLPVSLVLFVVVAYLFRGAQGRRNWLVFGLVTVVCYVVALLWFWQGAMRGLWFPPQLPLIEQFFAVDGEGKLDAAVSNLFFMLWFVALVFLGLRFLRQDANKQA